MPMIRDLQPGDVWSLVEAYNEEALWICIAPDVSMYYWTTDPISISGVRRHSTNRHRMEWTSDTQIVYLHPHCPVRAGKWLKAGQDQLELGRLPN